MKYFSRLQFVLKFYMLTFGALVHGYSDLRGCEFIGFVVYAP